MDNMTTSQFYWYDQLLDAKAKKEQTENMLDQFEYELFEGVEKELNDMKKINDLRTEAMDLLKEIELQIEEIEAMGNEPPAIWVGGLKGHTRG